MFFLQVGDMGPKREPTLVRLAQQVGAAWGWCTSSPPRALCYPWKRPPGVSGWLCAFHHLEVRRAAISPELGLESYQWSGTQVRTREEGKEPRFLTGMGTQQGFPQLGPLSTIVILCFLFRE